MHLLHFVCIRSVLKLNLNVKLWRAPCTIPLFCLITDKSVNILETFSYIGYAECLVIDINLCKMSLVYDTQCAFYWQCPRTFRTTLVYDIHGLYKAVEGPSTRPLYM